MRADDEAVPRQDQARADAIEISPDGGGERVEFIHPQLLTNHRRRANPP
jgi:hypothetical protein